MSSFTQNTTLRCVRPPFNQSINQSINQTLFTHGTISQRQKTKIFTRCDLPIGRAIYV
jgi:hypothetical protein